VLLAGCSSLVGPKYPTLIPAEYVPTAIALTVEAGRSVPTLASQAIANTTSLACPEPSGCDGLCHGYLPVCRNTVPHFAADLRHHTPAGSFCYKHIQGGEEQPCNPTAVTPSQLTATAE